MKGTIEQLTDNELHCWIRYLWHRVEAQKMAPAVFRTDGHNLWKGLLEDCMAAALERLGTRAQNGSHYVETKVSGGNSGEGWCPRQDSNL